nr:unnamed protein product [Callosobruchus analis]
MTKKVVKCIANVSYLQQSRELVKDFKILSLSSLYILEVSKYIFVHRHNYSLNSDFHTYNTRINSQFHLPVGKYKFSKHSPNYLGIKVFNHLPGRIKSCATVYNFIRSLTEYLINHCFYNIKECLSCRTPKHVYLCMFLAYFDKSYTFVIST